MVVLTIFDWFRMRDKTLIIPMLAGFLQGYSERMKIQRRLIYIVSKISCICRRVLTPSLLKQLTGLYSRKYSRKKDLI